MSIMDVDYVISYRFTDKDQPQAVSQFEQLITTLNKAGLQTQVRSGEKHSLLVFVKPASEQHLTAEVYRSRTKDWLHGVRSTQPKKEVEFSDKKQPLYPAERLRIIYQLITGPADEGGADITPKHGEWKNVESIFALHDHEYNKQWLKKWATQYVLTSDDLDNIRDRFGERVAYYFAFTQAYDTALIGIAAFGASAWLLLGHFSPIYAVVNGLLCVTFVEYWRQAEYDLAVRWGVRGVSSIENRRHDFKPDDKVTDPVTGEEIYLFSGVKRLQRQLLIVPFAAIATIILGAVIAGCFAIEIFMSEVYKGPGQSLLVFLPTGIMTTMEPLILGLLTSIAAKMTDYENHATVMAHETAMTQKVFILNFITSYLPIFLTAFVYVPFANVLVPYLDVFNLTVRTLSESGTGTEVPEAGAFRIDPSRLRQQVIYFVVTAQIVNQGMEVVLPYFKRQGFSKLKDFQSRRATKKAAETEERDDSIADVPEEAAFLKQVRAEAELDVYDVTVDLREMVVQYGYLALFSVIWPATGVSFLVNNWFELRTDAVKICIESQRPTPWRADSIGSWLDSLGFLTWLGSISTAAIVYLFHGRGEDGPGGDPDSIKGFGLLLAVLASEHTYLMSRWAVRLAIRKMDWPGRRQERAERYMVRKKYLEETLGQGGLKRASTLEMNDLEINRGSLENDARASGNLSQERKFWSRQRGRQETIHVGQKLIQHAGLSESKKGK